MKGISLFYAYNIPLHPYDHRRRVNIELKPNQLLHVCGANGSGKTTVLKCIAGLIKFPGGRSNIDSVCYIGSQPTRLDGLTVKQQLMYYQKIYEIRDETTSMFDTVIDEPVSSLSKGWQQRLHLAQLLYSQHPIWLLDEPFSGLDMTAVRWLNMRLDTYLQNGGSIILVDHTQQIVLDSILCLQL